MVAAAPRPHGMPLAPSGSRLLARLIDIFALLVLNAAVNGWFIYEYVKEIAPLYRELRQRWQEGNVSTTGLAASDRAGQLQLVIIVLAAALWFAYEVPAVANTGQTIGKKLLGLRVVRLESPGRVGFGRSLRRWNTMGLPTMLWLCCGVGFLLQFIDALFIAFDRPLRQALHDKSAFTVVVRAGKTDSAAAPDSSGGPGSAATGGGSGAPDDGHPGGTP